MAGTARACHKLVYIFIRTVRFRFEVFGYLKFSTLLPKLPHAHEHPDGGKENPRLPVHLQTAVLTCFRAALAACAKCSLQELAIKYCSKLDFGACTPATVIMTVKQQVGAWLPTPGYAACLDILAQPSRRHR